VAEFWRSQGKPEYNLDILKETPSKAASREEDDYDEKYDEAVAFVMETGQASVSLLQRRFKIGYNRAARLIERMEREGIVGPSDGVKPREVLIRKR
ncbi:MAG TPA: DNA translocase FtsK, partial [Deltaproteobacteria bacterium]|nr:DNA translocase FtsK [Deltaproteobacteria bacterium]